MESKLAQAKLVYVPIDQLVVAEGNTRKLDVLVNLDVLTGNIKEIGVQNPLVVNEEIPNKKYVIISGQRRWLASKAAGLREVPCLVVPKMSPTEQKIASLSENLYRNPMNDEDISKTVYSFYKQYKSVSTVAKKLGVSDYLVKKYIGYSQVSPEIKQLVDKKLLTVGQALNIYLKFSDPKQAKEIAYQIADLRSRTEKRAYMESVKRASSSDSFEVVKKRARQIQTMKRIIIEFPPVTSAALEKAAKAMGYDVTDVILEAVDQWLEQHKTLYSESG